MEASIKKNPLKRECYSTTLISAISYDQIIANQLIEGGVNAVVFENFIYNLMLSLKNNKEIENKVVVLFMDNAPIHKQEKVLQTAKRMGAIVLFNAEYSPWLIPIEMLFGVIKKRLTSDGINNR